ncbi:AsmA family protein [Stenoxybacter acetivorans]|uniref:AsmA family protein n=1 Tax=Stenoxybacter acetivorans TaxID=422441 RepID=UPI000564F1DC|nr:AsmA family protein [Stenoxybacter acetivorans]
MSLIIGLFVLLFRQFGIPYFLSIPRIETALQRAFEDTQRRVSFGKNFEYSLLPRPTVVLHQVRLSAPGKPMQTDISIDTMRIGFAWQSLLGFTKIEKWQWNGISADLYQLPNQQWSTTDLFHLWKKNEQTIAINRLQLRDLQLNIHDLTGQWHHFTHINLNTRALSENSTSFSVNGSWATANLPPIQWEITGESQQGTPRQWNNIHLLFDADLPYFGKGQGSIRLNGQWQKDQNSLQSNNIQWQWISNNHQFSAEGTGKNWQLGLSHLQLEQANALATTKMNDEKVNVNFVLNKLTKQAQNWHLAHFQVDNSWQNQENKPLLTINGDDFFSDSQQWELEQLHISSYQPASASTPYRRWDSKLNGKVTGRGLQSVQANLSGSFDESPVQLQATWLNVSDSNQHPQLSGSLKLNRLSLHPYWQTQEANNQIPRWQENWRTWLGDAQLNWQFDIGQVSSPKLQIESITGHINATSNYFLVDSVQAKLYEGTSNARLEVSNRTPLQWHLQQDLKHIQIQPWLQDQLDFHHLSGIGEVSLQVSSQGNNQAEWLQHLKGNALLQVQHGSWRGLDINNILNQNKGNTSIAFADTSNTEFKQLIIRLPVENGISKDSTTQLTSDNFLVTGQGEINWPTRAIDYHLQIETEKNQQQNRLPLIISGNLDHPNFRLDFQKLTHGLNTPQEKQDSIIQTLKRQWQWLNQGNRPASSPETQP